MIGIYKITNKINGKSYIGQSVNITERWRHHKKSTKKYPLYLAFQKYGLENFTWEILEECKKEELNTKELFYILKFNSIKQGYNQTLECNVHTHSTLFTDDILEDLYEDLENTTLSKEELAHKYECSERHIRDINNGVRYYNDELEYPLRKYWVGIDGKHYSAHLINGQLTNTICPICGGVKDSQAKMCKKCYNKALQKTERPSKEVLLKEVATLGFVKVGEKYGVSDKAIVKWCKAYNLPTHKKELKELYFNISQKFIDKV